MTSAPVSIDAGPGRTSPAQRLIAVTFAIFAVGTAIGVLLHWIGNPPGLGDGERGNLGFWEIFTTNVGVVGTMAIGVLTLGLVTVSVLFFNGVILGVVATAFIGAGDADVLWSGLAPHFVPEVAAFIVAAAADLRLVGSLARWVRRGEAPRPRWLLRAWVLPHVVVLLALLVAAVIEANVSGLG